MNHKAIFALVIRLLVIAVVMGGLAILIYNHFTVIRSQLLAACAEACLPDNLSAFYIYHIGGDAACICNVSPPEAPVCNLSFGYCWGEFPTEKTRTIIIHQEAMK